MRIGVPAETAPGERRVALVPETVGKLSKSGVDVSVQSGAGLAAAFVDDAYAEAGATLSGDANALFSSADVILKVRRPNADELGAMHAGQLVIGLLAPLGDPDSVRAYAERGLSAIAMEMIPRITRAQSMDALSSQANIGGYKAVLLAAEALPRFFPMLTTAAGTIAPAKVLVLGAGVAGLQAIATARRLGAVVTGYDTRAVVKEQVKSLGANFLELDLGVDAQGAGGYAAALGPEQERTQQELLAGAIAAMDVVITTAAVPGRRSPLLVTAEAVGRMKPGSVIVDLAAEGGGNCALTEPGAVVTAHGVTIIGTLNLPSTMPYHASQLYSRNVYALLGLLIKDGALRVDLNDEILKGATLTENGTIVHPQFAPAAATA